MLLSFSHGSNSLASGNTEIHIPNTEFQQFSKYVISTATTIQENM